MMTIMIIVISDVLPYPSFLCAHNTWSEEAMKGIAYNIQWTIIVQCNQIRHFS
jgi:hypothetical protein